MLAQETLRPADMFAYLLWVGLVGFSLNAGLLALERRLFGHRGDYDASVSS
jgi:ABC-type nitrate/sulfonate/bicarbonate transport system permease component